FFNIFNILIKKMLISCFKPHLLIFIIAIINKIQCLKLTANYSKICSKFGAILIFNLNKIVIIVFIVLKLA
ncbi:hypothetical protein CYB52_08345, partial [Campylobacter coli]|nr:hypothetical protein [Campylobacter coli]